MFLVMHKTTVKTPSRRNTALAPHTVKQQTRCLSRVTRAVWKRGIAAAFVFGRQSRCRTATHATPRLVVQLTMASEHHWLQLITAAAHVADFFHRRLHLGNRVLCLQRCISSCECRLYRLPLDKGLARRHTSFRFVCQSVQRTLHLLSAARFLAAGIDRGPHRKGYGRCLGHDRLSVHYTARLIARLLVDKACNSQCLGDACLTCHRQIRPHFKARTYMFENGHAYLSRVTCNHLSLGISQVL